MARIALVGGGSMGEALLSGLLRAGRQVKDLVVAERMPDRARYLAETYGVLVTSLPDAVENATFVIIAVKPSDVGSVVGEIGKVAAEADHDSPDQVFITVAAGVTTTYLESKLLAGTPVVRVMPNAPALVGAGVSAMAAGRFATPEQLKEVAALFDSVGGGADGPRGAPGRCDGCFRIGPGVLLLDDRGVGGRRGRGRAESRGVHRVGRADDGRARRRCCWTGWNRTVERAATRCVTCRWTPPRRGCVRLLPRRGAPLRLRCGNWKSTVCGRPSMTAVRAAKTRSEQLQNYI